MPVSSFIPIEGAKRVVEKQVKPKPSPSEITKIESPGRISEKELEPPEKKEQPRKKRTAKSDNIKDITLRDSILIITEKPQSAQKIAQALSPSPRKITENNASYFELSRNSEKIIVASAVGHLFNLTYVKGQKGYPVFQIEWTPSYEKSSAAFTKRYFFLLKKLARKAKEFIVATDYDIEGEVIGWNVLRFIANQKTAKRMKYSTLTKNELLSSYQNPLPELDWGQAYAGETRHILDWLYGINLSRALMSAIKTSGSFKILSIGRVQGPALKIIVQREREIENFKSQPYWQVFAFLPNSPIKYKHPKDIFDKSELHKFNNIKEAQAETKISDESISPPPPFDLTSLQREAYRLHNMTPSETLRVAQKLYLDGLISYPRTSSQKLPDSIKPKEILKSLSKHFSKLTSIATRAKPIEGKKSDPAHPSIYPTGEFQALSANEEKLFNIIVKRFISAFSPDAITENKRTILTALPSEAQTDVLKQQEKITDNYSDTIQGGRVGTSAQKEKITFTASGLKIKNPGWTQVYPSLLEEKDIPTINGKVKIEKIQVEEKETQPPKRYTPASLITILEKKNLGTKATRSMIVDTLFDRGYLDGKSIKATPLGIKLIESLEKYSPIIIDENLTRQLEEQMEKIRSSKSGFSEKEEKTIKTAEKLITDISKEFKAKEKEIGSYLLKGIESHREEQKSNSIIMPCPRCKKGNLVIKYSKKTNRYFAACDTYPECTETYSLPPNSLIKTTGKTNEAGLPLLVALRKGKRPWEFPFNPNWKDEQAQADNQK